MLTANRISIDPLSSDTFSSYASSSIRLSNRSIFAVWLPYFYTASLHRMQALPTTSAVLGVEFPILFHRNDIHV